MSEPFQPLCFHAASVERPATPSYAQPQPVMSRPLHAEHYAAPEPAARLLLRLKLSSSRHSQWGAWPRLVLGRRASSLACTTVGREVRLPRMSPLHRMPSRPPGLAKRPCCSSCPQALCVVRQSSHQREGGVARSMGWRSDWRPPACCLLNKGQGLRSKVHAPPASAEWAQLWTFASPASLQYGRVFERVARLAAQHANTSQQPAITPSLHHV